MQVKFIFQSRIFENCGGLLNGWLLKRFKKLSSFKMKVIG
jgi:hypothetical protein